MSLPNPATRIRKTEHWEIALSCCVFQAQGKYLLYVPGSRSLSSLVSIPPHTRYNPFVHILPCLLLSQGVPEMPTCKATSRGGRPGPARTLVGLEKEPVCARLSVRCHASGPKRIIYNLSVRVRCPCDPDSELQSYLLWSCPGLWASYPQGVKAHCLCDSFPSFGLLP